MELVKLQTYIDELSKINTKLIPDSIETFFDIAGFPHYELVCSNFYAYYFDPNASHGLNDLFLSSLCELIKSKTNISELLNNLYNCQVKKEVSITSGRLDILITEPSKNRIEFENSIIIENKIYASLDNELSDYYNKVKSINKVGVVLSLREEKDLPKEYINITHSELIAEIEKASYINFSQVKIKNLIIFKDFIQNLKNMAERADLSEQYDFYFQNQEKIQELSKFNDLIVSDVFQQASEACEMLDMNLTLGAPYHSRLRYYISSNKVLAFTILLEEIFNKPAKLKIFIEIWTNGFKYLDKINKIDFSKEEKIIHEKSPVRKSHIHYARCEFEPLSDDIKGLSLYIVNKIAESGLRNIFEEIEKCIGNKHDMN